MSVIVGTNGNDDLDGTSNNDLIISGNGEDIIDAGGGNDLIFSGNGDDIINAGDGNDVVVAGRGDDQIDGGEGHDLIFGGKGDDTILGGGGNDLIFGGKGDDTIDGGEGCDIISAGKGNDTVIFDVDENIGAQNYFSGGSGNDTLRLRLTQAQLDEMTAAGVFLAFSAHVGSHSGFDFSTFGLSFAIDLKVWYFEQLEVEVTSAPGLFTANDDMVDFNAVVAGTYPNGTQYDALGGNDTVTLANTAAAAAAAGYVVGTAFNAGSGDDTVTGGALDDIINGDAGNDILNGGTGVDVLNGGADDDRLILEDITIGDSVDGGDGTDTFVFAAANGANHSLAVAPTQITVDGTSISVTNVENYELSGADGDDAFVLGSIATGDIADGKAGNDRFTFDDDSAASSTITIGAGSLTVDAEVISLVDIETMRIEAGAGNDIINGAAPGEVLQGQAGDDTIFGNGGNDIVQGGTGVDTLFGGMGDDSLSMSDANTGDSADGGGGTDTFTYDDDTNSSSNITIGLAGVTVDSATIMLNDIEQIRIEAGNGNDTIIGSAVGDIIQGQGDHDIIMAGAGNDVAQGGDGNDVVSGGTGTDVLDGGAGDDRLSLDDINAGDNINGGADTDTFVHVLRAGSNHTVTTSATQVDVDGTILSVTNVENYEFTGAELDDSFTTGDGDDVLIGGDGNDDHNAAGGDNILSGGAGNDRFAVTDGSNTIDGGAGADQLFFINPDLTTFTGDVTFNFVTGTASVAGGGNSTVTGIETLFTGSGDDMITGDGSNNAIFADGGNNTIFGGGGNDSISVTDGNNTIDGGAGTNSLNMSSVTADTTVNLATNTASVAGVAGTSSVMNIATVFTGTGDDTVTGDGLNNAIFVGDGNNTVSAGGGNDTIVVTDGNNTIDGGADSDTLNMNSLSADITLDLSANTASVAGVAGTSSVANIENVNTGSGNDTVTGDIMNNALNGAAGTDTLEGGGGGDSLTGGAGSDSFVYRAISDSSFGLGDAVQDFDATDDLEDLVFIGLEQGSFNFVGAGPFTATGNTEANFNDVSKLLGVDVDGDGTADMGMILSGVALADLDADDFSFI